MLGAEGARGLAHIGVIQWLTEQGYDIRGIAGSSIGALVGGIYAGRQLDVYAPWVQALERMRVVRWLDPTFGRAGLIKGDRIMGVLRELIGEFDIEQLPLSFTAVATDLDSGEEVWLQDGKLFDAIRASIATALVFTPFRRGHRTLLDGALVNPLPIAPILQDGTELTVAVDLSGPAQSRPETPRYACTAGAPTYGQRIRSIVANLQSERAPIEPAPGLLDVAFVSMQAMQDTIARPRLASYSPDITVEIPRNACGFYEFWRAQEMISLGRERAAQAFARYAPPP